MGVVTHSLVYIYEPNTGIQWLYIDNIQVASSELIYAETWVKIINKYESFSSTRIFELTDNFGERVGYDFNKMPMDYTEFEDDDLWEHQV